VGEDRGVSLNVRRRPTVPYLAGLRLSGRRVVVLGAGGVVERRLPLLLHTGAAITVISPAARPVVVEAAGRGELRWERRIYQPGDLTGAWYVLAATNDPVANAAASQEAEAAQIFCVRADDATASSAWTPATAEVDGITIGVLAGRDPRRAVAVRELLVEALRRIARRAA